MSFRARFPGRCAWCDERIWPGQAVDYDEDGDLLHEHCLDSPAIERRQRVALDDDPDLTPGETCPECFTIKAVNGACSCP